MAGGFGKHPFLYTLTTSLYYPAVLGVVFYSALTHVSAGVSLEDLPLLFAYGGILLAFSIDFLYSVAARDYYGTSLFISDTLVLLLMVSAYTSLLEGVRHGGSLARFYLSLGLIHFVFILWDAWCVPHAGGRRTPSLVVYDALGLLASVVGLLVFRSSRIAAISVLWTCAILYLALGLPAIRSALQKGS